MRACRLLVVLVVAALVAPAWAATIVPPRDLGELARSSELVVLARAEAAHGEWTGAVPATVTRFRTLERISGAAVGETFEVEEVGGVVGEVGFAAPGVPEFSAGETYLLFLHRRSDGRWGSAVLSYGLLRLEAEDDLLVPLEQAEGLALVRSDGTTPVTRYRAGALLEHLREVAIGLPFRQDRVAADPFELPDIGPSPCVQLIWGSGGGGDDMPVRWFGFETGTTTSIKATTPGQVGIGDGGASAVSSGVAAWSGFTDGVIGGLYGGVSPWSGSCGGGSGVTAGEVVFNDPCSDITDLAGCSGTLAIGGAFFSTGLTPYDGFSWHSASAQFVIVNNGSSCIGATDFAEMMTHEVGHTYGFGHHGDSAATMYFACCHAGRGAAIAATDKKCASFQYHTFTDVPYSYWAWKFIEAIQNASVTSGCGSGIYCPTSSVKREQMAVFLLKAKFGGGYTPPACTVPTFSDVPCASPYSSWIEDLAAKGITTGCGGGKYCPLAAVTREQMAVFLLRTDKGSGYTPPPCTVPSFSDVPCASPYASWIEDLVSRGITSGCGGGMYCPTATNDRDQMAVFLTRTFSLPTPP